MKRKGTLFLILLGAMSSAVAEGPRQFNDEQLTFFESKIRPVRVAHKADQSMLIKALRYRDYLIEAYQKDKPFDRFVREQIAGDLLPAGSPTERAERITATGFLMVGDMEIVEPDQAKLEADHIDTQVSKIGMTFLGMTLGCVRCHDHKFDPLELSDYYGIAGMLRSSPSTHKIPFGVWSLLNSTVLPETSEQLAVRQKLEADHEAKLAEMKAERAKLEAEKKSVAEELALELVQLEQAPKVVADASVSEATPVRGETTALAEVVSHAPAKKEALIKRHDNLAEQIKKLGPAIQQAGFFRSKAPRAFAMHDGGGIQSGFTYGETDHMGYRVVAGKIHIHDLHATMLHLLGIDYKRLTWNHLGRDFRLTDVHGSVVREILA